MCADVGHCARDDVVGEPSSDMIAVTAAQRADGLHGVALARAITMAPPDLDVLWLDADDLKLYKLRHGDAILHELIAHHDLARCLLRIGLDHAQCPAIRLADGRTADEDHRPSVDL